MRKIVDEEFISFLVTHRAQIQEAIRKLYFLSHRDEQLTGGTTERVVRGLLVGASFSLWRAVFTASQPLDQPTNIDQSLKFLKNLIETNAVAFQAEQNSWAFGYYINNARFRLRAAYDLLPEDVKERYLSEYQPLMISAHQLLGIDAYKAMHVSFLALVDLLDSHLATVPYVPWSPNVLKTNPTYE